MAADNGGDLRRMDEHAFDLGALVGPAHPAFQASVGPATGTDAGQEAGQITCGKADQRIGPGGCGDHNLADLSFCDRLAGAGAYDLDDYTFIDDQALLRF